MKIRNLLAGLTLLALSAAITSAADAPKAFTQMDANRDGQVSQSEWLQHAAQSAKKKGADFDEKKALKAMQKRDTNGDKMISVEEFAATMKGGKDDAEKKKKTD